MIVRDRVRDAIVKTTFDELGQCFSPTANYNSKSYFFKINCLVSASTLRFQVKDNVCRWLREELQ